MDDGLICWLKDGKYRLTVLRMLSSGSMISSEIARNLQVHRSSASRILKGLKDRGLLERIAGGSRTAMYVITETGLEALGQSMEIE